MFQMSAPPAVHSRKRAWTKTRRLAIRYFKGHSHDGMMDQDYIRRTATGWHGIAIRAIALLGAPLLFFVFRGLAFDYLPIFQVAPCENRDGLDLTAHGLEAVLLAVGVGLQIRILQRPSYALLIAALLIPLTAWLIQEAANERDAFRQRQCAARPLEQAMIVCGANPAHYRRGKDQYGYDVLTVIAPGTTDKAWSCLSSWSNRNGTASIKVDESVYREARRAYFNQR